MLGQRIVEFEQKSNWPELMNHIAARASVMRT